MSGAFRSWLIDARNSPRIRSVDAARVDGRSCARANSRNTPPRESMASISRITESNRASRRTRDPAEDVGRAGLADRARGDRDVGGEALPEARPQDAGERGRHEAEEARTPRECG